MKIERMIKDINKEQKDTAKNIEMIEEFQFGNKKKLAELRNENKDAVDTIINFKSNLSKPTASVIRDKNIDLQNILNSKAKQQIKI